MDYLDELNPAQKEAVLHKKVRSLSSREREQEKQKHLLIASFISLKVALRLKIFLLLLSQTKQQRK